MSKSPEEPGSRFTFKDDFLKKKPLQMKWVFGMTRKKNLIDENEILILIRLKNNMSWYGMGQ